MASSGRTIRIATIAAAALCTAARAQAQATLMPPALLAVTCEWVKPGMGPAHDQHEERWALASEAVKGFAPSLAVQSSTGPAESCWLTALTSYDQLGRNNDLYSKDAAYSAAMPSLVGADARFISESRNYIALLRPDLSSGDMPNVLTRRVTGWGEWRVRFGTEPVFIAALKAYTAAATRAGTKPQFRVYQVAQGAPEVTFWIFSSETAMAGFDAALANGPKIAAVYTPDDMKAFDEATSKSIVSVNSNIWSYSSAQSSLTAEQRASDPFWKRKPAMIKKP